MPNKPTTPEDRLNSARIRERIGELLRGNYQACATAELPPRLHEVLKKLDEEKPERSGEEWTAASNKSGGPSAAPE